MIRGCRKQRRNGAKVEGDLEPARARVASGALPVPSAATATAATSTLRASARRGACRGLRLVLGRCAAASTAASATTAAATAAAAAAAALLAFVQLRDDVHRELDHRLECFEQATGVHQVLRGGVHVVLRDPKMHELYHLIHAVHHHGASVRRNLPALLP